MLVISVLLKLLGAGLTIGLLVWIGRGWVAKQPFHLRDQFPLAFLPGLDAATWDREFGNLYAFFQCRIPAWEWDWSAMTAQYAAARDRREMPWEAFARLAELQGIQLDQLQAEPKEDCL